MSGVDETFTVDEVQAIVVALELRRLRGEWASARLRDAAAAVEARLARELNAIHEPRTCESCGQELG